MMRFSSPVWLEWKCYKFSHLIEWRIWIFEADNYKKKYSTCIWIWSVVAHPNQVPLYLRILEEYDKINSE